MTPARGTTVIAYVRASTRKQPNTGEAQVRAVRARRELEAAEADADRDTQVVSGHCESHGLVVVDVVREVRSAGEGKRRPLLEAALARLDAGEAQGLVVSSLDRLARSSLDFAGILKRAQLNGWAVICLNPSVDMSMPEGKVVATLLMAFAEYERELISRRTRAALEVYREQQPDGFITQEIDARILKLHDEGMSMNGIARTLTDFGVPTARGAPAWTHKTVQPAVERALRRRRANNQG